MLIAINKQLLFLLVSHKPHFTYTTKKASKWHYLQFGEYLMLSNSRCMYVTLQALADSYWFGLDRYKLLKLPNQTPSICIHESLREVKQPGVTPAITWLHAKYDNPYAPTAHQTQQGSKNGDKENAKKMTGNEVTQNTVIHRSRSCLQNHRGSAHDIASACLDADSLCTAPTHARCTSHSRHSTLSTFYEQTTQITHQRRHNPFSCFNTNQD